MQLIYHCCWLNSFYLCVFLTSHRSNFTHLSSTCPPDSHIRPLTRSHSQILPTCLSLSHQLIDSPHSLCPVNRQDHSVQYRQSVRYLQVHLDASPLHLRRSVSCFRTQFSSRTRAGFHSVLSQTNKTLDSQLQGFHCYLMLSTLVTEAAGYLHSNNKLYYLRIINHSQHLFLHHVL